MPVKALNIAYQRDVTKYLQHTTVIEAFFEA